jgi:predicted kinase
MERMRPHPPSTGTDARLLLTCGLPGAGKTRLATQLAADRRAVRLTKDGWLRVFQAPDADELALFHAPPRSDRTGP